MLVGHKVIYIRNANTVMLYGAVLQEKDLRSANSAIDMYNYHIYDIINSSKEYYSYMVICEDGIIINGFLMVDVFEQMYILTDDDLMIKDILE